MKYTLSVILVAQKLVALRFRDDKMYWEYSYINVIEVPTNLLHLKNVSRERKAV